MYKVILLITLCLLIGPGCKSVGIKNLGGAECQGQPVLPALENGYRLYSWTANNRSARLFSLVSKTNTRRSFSQFAYVGESVKDGQVKITVVGTARLKSALCRLPMGTPVNWDNQTPGTDIPGVAMVRDIREYAKGQKLDLRVGE